MPIPKNYPLESFDPRFEQILLRGSRGEDFTIPCRTRAEAYRLQHMLNAYRSRCRAELPDQPDKWKPMFTAAVGLLKDDKGQKTIVRVYSRHNEFGDLLDNIVEKPAELPSDPLAEFEPVAKPEGSGGG